MHRLISISLSFGIAFLSHLVGAQIQAGMRAPAIRTSKVLSPPGKTVSTKSLAGKTVVLDFWATWCGPCIASMPHMNELEASLDSNRFVFIALDDEDAETVQKFLSKQKVNAIVALDRQGETFKAFHVASRPVTIVINPMGEVALVTQPEELERKTLIEIDTTTMNRVAASSNLSATDSPGLADRARQPGQPAMKKEVHATKNSGEIVLSGVLLQRKQPEEQEHSISHSSNGRVTYVGFEARELLQMGLGVSDRYIEHGDVLPTGTFDLTMKLDDLDESRTEAILLAVLEQGFGLDIAETSRPEGVLILKRTPSGEFKATESVNQAASTSMQQHGDEIAFANATTRNIAGLIERRTGLHVVDETHVRGKYDGVLHWSGSIDHLDEALQKDLGLTVERATRPVSYYIVSKHKRVAP